MEKEKDQVEKDRSKSPAEWKKPTVKELDINAITLSGFSGTGMDNAIYS